MITECTYQLKQSFKYAAKGDYVDAQFIIIKAPSSKNISFVAPIKQAMTMAIQYSQEKYSDSVIEDKDSDNNDDDLDGETIISLIEASGADMEKLVLHFQNFFVRSGLFLVDGEEKLTIPLVNELSINDFYGLGGEFIKNFILASQMNQNEKSSKE